MNQTQYLERFQEITNDMYQITKAKNNDYAGEKNTDPFANFRVCEKIGCCTTEQGFIVRITDKVKRIVNLLTQENSVKDEKITDTLLDLANYSILLKIYLESKEK